MKRIDGKLTKPLAAVIVAAVALIAGGGTSTLASATSSRAVAARGGFSNRVLANGAKIKHKTATGSEAVSNPDDITLLGGQLFVGFQNGVGPQGEASTTGNKDSTVVEFNLSGKAVRQWDLVGKCDGITADPAHHRLIATVNEDANSSLYTIDPSAGAAVHYRYSGPLPSRGGTDAIEVYNGLTLISASAPGTTGAPAPKASYPAVYRAVFHAETHVVTLRALFSDKASARVANTTGAQRGKRVLLALTDPDSNEIVPAYAHRFADDFMLTSQGDKQQIFVSRAGSRHQALSVLDLSDSVDDTVWPSDSSGAIYATDNSNDTINKITGPYKRGTVLVADTPCGSNSAPSTCPAAGFPPDYLGELNPNTGVITRVAVHGPTAEVQGMLFVP